MPPAAVRARGAPRAERTPAALRPPTPRPRSHMVRTWRQLAALIGVGLPRGGAARPAPPMRGAGVPRVTSRVAERGAERSGGGGGGGEASPGAPGAAVPPGGVTCRGRREPRAPLSPGALPLFSWAFSVTLSFSLYFDRFYFLFLFFISFFFPSFFLPPQFSVFPFFPPLRGACAAFSFSFNFTKGSASPSPRVSITPSPSPCRSPPYGSYRSHAGDHIGCPCPAGTAACTQASREGDPAAERLLCR